MRARPLLLITTVVAAAAAGTWALFRVRAARAPILTAVGPRLTSNDTAQPLALYGLHFRNGLKLRLGAPYDHVLPVHVVDATHAYAKLPGDLEIPASEIQAVVGLSLEGGRGPAIPLTLVNNRHFPDPRAVAAVDEEGGAVLAVSTTTDVGMLSGGRRAAPLKVPLGDGPSAVAVWRRGPADALFVVAHAYAPELRLVRADTGTVDSVLPGPPLAAGITVDSTKGVAYVSEEAADSVVAVDLRGRGRVLWRTKVAPNPRELALAGPLLAVGSLQAGVVELLSTGDGRLVRTAAPTPGVSIVGGHTEPYGSLVMGGKAVRGLAYSARLKKLFVSSVGPNIGPNADRMEVTMNSGVGVVDVETGRFERHLGLNAGVPSGVVVDDDRGLLYLADTGLGQVHVIDAAALAAGDAEARGALLQSVAVPPPPGFPLVRPAADFQVRGRAGVELHSGPWALALAPDGARLWVLNRFSGTLAELDTRQRGGAVLARQTALFDMLEQPERRQGEVLYYADMGRSSMSCDACHMEGHTEGILFAKTHPLRIYRSPTVRDARDTPPYFTPASTFSLAQTMDVVGNRNRYRNPKVSPFEIEALALFTATWVTLPNPFVGADGAPVDELALPSGETGHPLRGMAIFEARCAACHPPPLFTTDQDPATRGRFMDVGTPNALPLRTQLQEIVASGFAPPSLLGAWDVFPMLGTGAAGLRVQPDGAVRMSHRSALQDVLESYSGPKHGNAQALSPSERRDLWAYVMSL